jgi:hypothetical protein
LELRRAGRIGHKERRQMDLRKGEEEKPVMLPMGEARKVDPRRAGEDGAPPGINPCVAAESVKERDQRRAAGATSRSGKRI